MGVWDLGIQDFKGPVAQCSSSFTIIYIGYITITKTAHSPPMGLASEAIMNLLEFSQQYWRVGTLTPTGLEMEYFIQGIRELSDRA